MKEKGKKRKRAESKQCGKVAKGDSMGMKTNHLIIFEGSMCCSTGLCGPEPDKTLIELSDALKKLQADFPDLAIMRASLSFNAKAFLENKEVLGLVRKSGAAILPITVFNGQIISKQKYLKYDELKTAIEKSRSR